MFTSSCLYFNNNVSYFNIKNLLWARLTRLLKTHATFLCGFWVFGEGSKWCHKDIRIDCKEIPGSYQNEIMKYCKFFKFYQIFDKTKTRAHQSKNNFNFLHQTIIKTTQTHRKLQIKPSLAHYEFTAHFGSYINSRTTSRPDVTHENFPQNIKKKLLFVVVH